MPEEVKEERWQRFMAKAQAISAAKLAARVGTRVEVIVDEVDDEAATCRTRGDAPEIDGNLFIDEDFAHLRPGDRLTVTVEEAERLRPLGPIAESQRLFTTCRCFAGQVAPRVCYHRLCLTCRQEDRNARADPLGRPIRRRALPAAWRRAGARRPSGVFAADARRLPARRRQPRARARSWPAPGPPAPARTLDRAAARGRIDPAALGLAAAFAAAVPLAGRAGGFLLAAATAGPAGSPPRSRFASPTPPLLAAPLLARAARAAPRRGRGPSAPPSVRAPPRSAWSRRRCAPAPPARPAGLMILDLDRFHAVNEALGVAAGDALLAVTGTRLEQALDPGDRLIRLEGDRFVIVAPRGPAALRALARRLLQAVSQPLVLDGRTARHAGDASASSPPPPPTRRPRS